MTRLSLFTSSLLFSSILPLLAHAGPVTQDDITGPGEIWVLEASDWQTASPKQKVGCLTDSGRFISSNHEGKSKCGVFEMLTDYPYTFSSKAGNCSFNDEKTERNTDSVYGKWDHAWSCNAWYEGDVYDGLYTINGFNYPFLCWGDIACFYDVKKVPGPKDRDPLWQYRWGAQQRGITPGHTQVMLLFSKLGHTPKREGLGGLERLEGLLGPRIAVHEGMQALLQGQEVKTGAL